MKMKTMFESMTITMFAIITMRMASTHTPFVRKKRAVFLTLLALLAALNLCRPNVQGQSRAPVTNQQNSSTPKATPDARINQEQADGFKIYALRLRPGQDLRTELERFAKERNIKAGFIMTAVGSLKKAALRLADQSATSSFEGKYEIVSLVGTLSPDGVHLHISLSDSNGKTIGGHLVAGCEIYTTAEIIVGEATGIIFTREKDKTTGYQELKIRRSKILKNSRPH
jgi:predicted DNA-binding protein with PD1-like motif